MDASASLSLYVAAARPPRQAVASVQIVAVAYGAWLLGLTVFASSADGSKVVAELALLAGVVPAILQSALLPADTRGNGPGMWFMWAFATVFLASYLVNVPTWEDLPNVFNVAFVFLIGLLIASSTDDTLLKRAMAAFAVMTACYLLYINLFGSYQWGRLTAGASPNTWGFVALNVAAGAFCVNSRLLAAFCWAVVLLTMYNAQARGSMIAALPFVFISCYHLLVYQRRIDVSWKAAGTAAVLIAGIVSLAVYPDFVTDKVLRLNDSRRGLESGATGRDEAWAEGLHIWIDNPVLGVGYRNHEQHMRLTRLNAHNALISMLADTGILGFLLYTGFLLATFHAALRGIADPKLRLFAAAVIVSYAVAGLFERRAINVGNAYSITFILTCLLALRHARFPFVAQPKRVRVMPGPAYVEEPAARPAAAEAGGADADPRTERAREVIEAYFDVDAFALAGLGRHRVSISIPRWREYRGLLRDLIVHGYALHFADLSAGDLQVSKVVPHGSRRATVHSKVRRADGQSLCVDWRIRSLTRGGGFKVTDVVIEGASAASTLRADVSAMMAAGGIEQVCSVLREQVEAMKASLG
ncbi:MAG: ABC transporter substrate-binding protein [Rhodospirillales bacterium]|nr:ABC transporter substrate-binding protein [Rhodospirillales bacterium]